MHKPRTAVIPGLGTVTPHGDVSATEWSEVKPAAIQAASRVFDTRDFATPAEYAANATPGLLAMFSAIQAAGGGTMFFAPGEYHIETELYVTLSVPFIMDLNGQTVTVHPDISIYINAQSFGTGLSLASAIARGSQTINLTNASTVQEGDILYFSESVAMESAWNTPRLATYSVRKKTGNTITLTAKSKMPFSTSATIIHYRPPSRMTVKNGEIRLQGGTIGVSGESRALRVRGFRGATIDDLTFTGDQEWDESGPVGVGLSLERCVDTRVVNPHAELLSMGVLLNTSYNTLVSNMTAERIRGPVIPGSWADGVMVNGLVTNDVYKTVESHPAFDVNYANVVAKHDRVLPNMRSVGGSITNARIYVEMDDSGAGPHWHSLELTDPSWYDDAVLSLTDVEIISPNLVDKSAIAAKHGHFKGSDVIAYLPSAGASAVGNWGHRGELRSLSLSNCRNPDGTPWGRRTFRTEVSVLDPPNVPAYLSGGVHHIDPFRTFVTTKDGVLTCYGRLLPNGASTSNTVRIHTNAMGGGSLNNFPNYVYGVLKLRLMVQRISSSSPDFDIKTEEYRFRHVISAPSSVDFPTTPAFSDDSTRSTITLSSPSQAGVTQLGTHFPDTYVQFDLTVSSSVSVPNYSMTYELELVRGH